MNEFLKNIVTAKRQELAIANDDTAPAREPSPPRGFEAALRLPGISAIAEIKRRSPSRGSIRPDLDPVTIAREYASHGARAISVLTERTFFGGSDADLVAARESVSLPVLQKDFIIDPVQVEYSRRIGADAILLIARILGRVQLTELLDAARKLGMAALVEVHDESELQTALDSGARIIGVNNRNLDTFEVDRDTALRLRPLLPDDRVSVAESGIRGPEDVWKIAAGGYDAILVGEALMKAAQPGASLRRLLGDPVS